MASTATTQNTKRTNPPPPPPPPETMVRFSIREDDQNDDVSIRHKRRRFPSPASRSILREHDFSTLFTDDDEDDVPLTYRLYSTASGSQPRPNEDAEDEDADEDDELDLTAGEDESESDDDDDDVIHEVTDDVQRTCTACWRLPVVADVAVGRTTVEKNVDVTEVVDNNNASGALSAVFTDPDVLDCPICLEALCVPVYQCENGHIACDSCFFKCENGHIACDSCCSKVKRKCPSCCMPIGYNRCRAIEKVIESVQVSCKYAQYGCRETMTYNKKQGHEQLCPHVTCFCPQPSCPFAGSSKNLYFHFGIQHAASTTRFTYNTAFILSVELNQKHIFLQEQRESVLFILNHEVKEHGRAFNVDCVGPSTLKTCFEYQLIAKNTETSLSIQSVPEIYSKWSEHTLKKSYLTVPSDFLGSSGILSLNVCIKKAILSV